ncbi:MAG: hypothetical protein RL220_1482 [Bacteroidota bacterium]
MKKVFLSLVLVMATTVAFSQVYEFYQMTTVESVVPGGLGRSRMILTNEKGEMQDLKMENFFSLVGINFENIRFNDQMIGDKLGDLSAEGWELQDVSSAAYGHESSTGIFITRYLFKRPKK